jgi:hypothetical protein
VTRPPAGWPDAEVPAGPLWNENTPGPRLPAPLLARWREGLREWNAPSASVSSLERLVDPRTRVVVTGQQPGPWGGPLYNLYKAATATALAAAIAARGTPAVAVFWVQGDDADWGEVGWGALPRPDLSLFTHRWEAPVPPRHWIGSARLAAPPERAEIAKGWGGREALLGSPGGSEPEELSRGFIDFLLAWFGGNGLVPLDARWPELRAAGGELWRAYLERHEQIAVRVVEAGEALGAAGKLPLLTGDAPHRGLFVLDGETRRDTDPAAWEGEVRARVNGSAAKAAELAPSVLLRAVLQDRLFGTAAHVVGEGESAYLEQLEPVYASLDVEPPVRVARLRGVIAPAGVVDADGARRAVFDPEGWVAGEAAARVDGARLDAIRSAREAATGALGPLTEPDADGRKDLAEVAESARRKIDRELARVEEVIARRARQDLYREHPRLRHLPEFFRPRRGEQERGLSAASAALLLGNEAPERVLGAASAHLERLAAGRWDRFYLEEDRD